MKTILFYVVYLLWENLSIAVILDKCKKRFNFMTNCSEPNIIQLHAPRHINKMHVTPNMDIHL